MKYFEGAQLLLWWSPTYGPYRNSVSPLLVTSLRQNTSVWVGGCLFAGEMWDCCEQLAAMDSP
jgi:hypothetical protein